MAPPTTQMTPYAPPPAYAEVVAHGDEDHDTPSPPRDATVSALRQRTPVQLGQNGRWHSLCLLFRALTMTPALYWAVKIARLDVTGLEAPEYVLQGGRLERRRVVVEACLATLWVCSP